MMELPVVSPTCATMLTQDPPLEPQGAGRHPPPDSTSDEESRRVAALWAGLYRLAIRLGWTWDGERWRDAEGAPVTAGGGS
jgi:hypothetical protein